MICPKCGSTNLMENSIGDRVLCQNPICKCESQLVPVSEVKIRKL